MSNLGDSTPSQRNAGTYPTELAFEARSNSVTQLANLYRVVISIAFGLACQSVVDPQNSPPFDSLRLAPFFSFTVTVVPFFHGAVRHLYATYVEGGGSSRVQNWVILIDYFLLFIGGGLFVALASSLGDRLAFETFLICLLVLDVCWGILAAAGIGGTGALQSEISWAKINFVAAAVLMTFVWSEALLVELGMDELDLQLFVLGVTVIRTSADYYFNHTFYFPPHPRHG